MVTSGGCNASILPPVTRQLYARTTRKTVVVETYDTDGKLIEKRIETTEDTYPNIEYPYYPI